MAISHFAGGPNPGLIRKVVKMSFENERRREAEI
jgi:hypothetical protein